MFRNSTPLRQKNGLCVLCVCVLNRISVFTIKIKDEKHLPTRDLSVIILYVSMCGKG